MRRTRWLPALLLAACSGASPDVMQASPDLTSPAADVDLATALLGDMSLLRAAPDLGTKPLPDLATNNAYPNGPYGNAIGSVVAPLVWEGYVNPTAQGDASTKPYQAMYSMNDLRTSGAKFAILYGADYW